MAKLLFIFGNGKTFSKYSFRKSGILFLLAVFTSLSALAQQIELKGKILEENSKLSVIGATIRVKGQKAGTTSDVDGNFTLKVKSLPTTLNISTVGFKTQEIDVYEADPVTILLADDQNRLNEVVVVSTGYTTHKKSEYTGSISSIKSDQFEDRPSQSFDQLLGGQSAGLDVTSASGELNTPAVLRIRGVNSITSGIYPLIVIDGTLVNTGNVGGNIAQNPLGDINPNDIETVDVLKDAAATSLYGSRAANGVLVITTKRGKKGKPRVNYDAWVSYSTPYLEPKLLGAEDYVTIKNEGLVNAGNTTDKYILLKDANGKVLETDWQKVAFRNAYSQSHSINVSGATDYTTYYLSANYTDQSGIIKYNELERQGVRFNLDQKVIKNVNVGTNFNFSNAVNSGHIESGNLTGQGLSTQDLNRQIVTLPPNVLINNQLTGNYNYQLPSTYITGGTTNNTYNTGYNSYNLQTQLDLDRTKSATKNALGNVYGEWKIIDGLKARTSYGLNFLNVQNSQFFNSISGGSANSGGSATNSSNTYYNQDWVSTLNFDKTLLEKHSINATIGYEEVYTKTDNWGATRTTLTDPSFNIFQGGYTTSTTSGSFSETGLRSYFINANYAFDKRYLIGGSLRRDGYSGLPLANQWGNFGSGSIGWNISEEGFIKNSFLSKYINNLKIYGSYGEVGNTNIGAYPSVALYSSATVAGASALVFNQAANNNLQWETSKKTDVGLTFSILKNRINFSADYYKNNVDGLILNVPTTPSLGLPGNNVNANAGSLYNQGVELSLNVIVLKLNHFTWSTTVNFSTLENKVTSLAADVYSASTFGIMNVTRQGYSIGSIFAVQTNGVDPANGNRIFVNATGKEVEYNAVNKTWIYKDGSGSAPAIDNYKDGKIQGNSLPTYFGGWNNTLQYKGFDFSFGFTFSGGNKAYDGNKATASDGRYFNNGTFILNRWTTVGQVTDIPKVVYGDNVSNGFTISNSYYVEDGSFIKLKNLALGYKFKLNKLTNGNISSARVYAQATNLFTLTKYQGGDPEINTYGNTATHVGDTRNSLPNAQTFTLGLNVSF